MSDSTNKPTSIFQAIKAGDIDTLSTLLFAGEHVHVRNDNGWTPLHDVAANGYSKVIEVLVKNGATQLSPRWRKPRPGSVLKARNRQGKDQLPHRHAADAVCVSCIL